MKDFKFFTKEVPIFRFEIVTQLEWSPDTLRDGESFNSLRSQLIKEWLSDYFFGDHPDGFEYTKYFPEFDRTCRIIQTGLDNNRHERVFSAIVRIQRGDSEYFYLDVHLQYLIDYVIYQS